MTIMTEDQVKRLYRSRNNNRVAGVCGGLGKYFGIDPVIIRVIWVISIFFYGFGLLFYGICWLVLALEPEEMGSGDYYRQDSIEQEQDETKGDSQTGTERVLKCPKCGAGVEVPAGKRPVTVECPGCGARANIKK